ncbi:hypothetical protein BDQ94DRAFT_176396 [Aspergillus welwitschiae]|uniref:Uncharacterized protein n=1 Tax=Aspergillus welwitschiae TaxID=1341132 RepID=A0A3F3PHH7_9EURO|nr:hypothetical protein BDQ94DRAFT_176396 [Aspergillus welwitschiae]RDH26414.1 hypothetical protein BDQ94DRAFT_176396 [Aspergillus welwitschiae]
MIRVIGGPPSWTYDFPDLLATLSEVAEGALHGNVLSLHCKLYQAYLHIAGDTLDAKMGGLALSLGVATSVLVNHATEEISHILPNVLVSEIKGAIDGVGSSVFATLTEQVRDQVTNAVTQSVASLFYPNLFGAALGFLIALPLKFDKLDFTALQ